MGEGLLPQNAMFRTSPRHYTKWFKKSILIGLEVRSPAWTPEGTVHPLETTPDGEADKLSNPKKDLKARICGGENP